MAQDDPPLLPPRTPRDVDQVLIALAGKYGIGMELRRFAMLLQDLGEVQRLIAAAELEDFARRNEIFDQNLGAALDARIRELREFTPADPQLWVGIR